ncbi:hypothetical protein [Ruminococcus sp.]|uniref:hypothetical protein n=1 Tax=Ruminococcus sp. TaxID=41978 RepID=UPI002583F765|nr:hypothetical protein [Ruminococcus sp.]MCR5022317.1 hypothetical protein [Ruminococcus sp.]
MSKVNFKETLKIRELTDVIGNTPLNMKQKKAVKNIRYCADNKWEYVNGWYDEENEDYRAFMLNPESLFDSIYTDSLTNEYDVGYVAFSRAAQERIRDIRFCGKEFLERVTFFYLIELMQESFAEVEGTEEDAVRIEKELIVMKERLGV